MTTSQAAVAGLIVLVVFTVTSCGDSQHAKETPSLETAAARKAAPRPPSTDEARQLIADSAEWSDFQSPYSAWSLPTSAAALKGAALEGAKDLQRGGWISLRAGDVVLTEKAKSDKRFLIRPNGSIDIVPLAKKEITAVTSVQPTTNNEVAVGLTWKWIPNEVGSAFRSGTIRDRFASPGKATVTLQPADGGGWEVLRIVPDAAP